MTPSLTFPVKRPSLALLGAKPWRAALEFLSHKLAPGTAPATGDGHPVLIFPGLGADGKSVAPLRKVCESLGYSAFDWGRGYNTGPQGDVDAWLRDLAAHSTELLKEHHQAATLIGWSLGGLYARELAKTDARAGAPGHHHRHAVQRRRRPHQRGMAVSPALQQHARL